MVVVGDDRACSCCHSLQRRNCQLPVPTGTDSPATPSPSLTRLNPSPPIHSPPASYHVCRQHATAIARQCCPKSPLSSFHPMLSLALSIIPSPRPRDRLLARRHAVIHFLRGKLARMHRTSTHHHEAVLLMQTSCIGLIPSSRIPRPRPTRSCAATKARHTAKPTSMLLSSYTTPTDATRAL